MDLEELKDQAKETFERATKERKVAGDLLKAIEAYEADNGDASKQDKPERG